MSSESAEVLSRDPGVGQEGACRWLVPWSRPVAVSGSFPLGSHAVYTNSHTDNIFNVQQCVTVLVGSVFYIVGLGFGGSSSSGREAAGKLVSKPTCVRPAPRAAHISGKAIWCSARQPGVTAAPRAGAKFLA